jgi:hypothetical protein
MMKSILALTLTATGLLLLSVPALAGPQVQVPEPMSMSLLAGGILAIAAVKRMRRK